MTERETTGQAIARLLVEAGVDTVFGIPGAHMYDFDDALYGVRDKIRFVTARHEQGAGYMAYGYAKSTGRLGVYTVVPGPGSLNSSAALCTAYGANTPVLCVTGNIMSDLIGRGRGQLHELPDQLATLRGLVKSAERIDHPSEAGSKFASVLTAMTSGRPGPGAIEAPWDVFGRSVPRAPDPRIERRPAPRVDDEAIAAAAARIAAAKRPLIMVGGGAVDAGPQVAALAEKIGAPVTSHRSGKGIVPDDHPHYLTFPAAYEYWRECDLLIGIGSRLELQFMRWKHLPKGLQIVRIDIDPTEMVRLRPDVAIVADAAEAVAALIDAVDAVDDPARVAGFAAANADARARFATVRPQVDYVAAIRRVLPRDGFFVEEVSQIGFTARFAFPTYGPRRYVTCGYQDNLGFGYGTALGVKFAHPDKAVVSISGDGGFLFGLQEMATAVQHRIAVVAVVFNNAAFGNVLRDQRQAYRGRVIGSELINPDFVRLAESFGMRAFRVTSPDALATRLRDALDLDEPVLIKVPVERGSEVSPWPFIHPPAP